MKNKKHLNLILVLIAIVLAMISVFLPAKYIVIFSGAVLGIIFFMRYLKFGLYLMVALYPFIYLQLWIGSEINIPYVDLIALMVFIAWGIKRIYLHLNNQKKIGWDDFFGLGVFVPFFIASLLSLTNVDNLGLGFKYVLRPIVFFYLMFVVLPYNVVDSKKELKNIFKIMFWVGIFVSLMGIYSFALPGGVGVFRRAVPISIFGINPLGTNHNLISEVLIAVIPITLILIWQERNLKVKKFLVLGIMLMCFVNLITFSRTGWIALLLQIIILSVTFFRKNLKKITPVLIVVALLFLPPIFLMFGFLDTPIVETSNRNRIQLTQIAIENFKEYPLFGAGAGTFIESVSRDEWYIIDFGIPLEAHGVAQKLIGETGALGLLTFGFLLLYLIKYLIGVYRKIPPESPWKLIMICLILSVVGSIVFQLFNTSYFVSKMWLPIGIALAASKIAVKENKYVT